MCASQSRWRSAPLVIVAIARELLVADLDRDLRYGECHVLSAFGVDLTGGLRRRGSELPATFLVRIMTEARGRQMPKAQRDLASRPQYAG